MLNNQWFWAQGGAVIKLLLLLLLLLLLEFCSDVMNCKQTDRSHLWQCGFQRHSTC